MSPLSKELTPPKSNPSSNYWPIRNKDNNFDWDILTGMVLSRALRLKLEDYGLEQFRLDCKAQFESKLDDHSFWGILDKMYFLNDAVFKISPLFLLFKTQHENAKNTANLRLEALFYQLIGNDFSLSGKIEDKLHFLEQEILTTLNHHLVKAVNKPVDDSAYLPFLVNVFRKDFAFLTENPRYFLQEITNVLKLYAFSYCSQLTLNVMSWKDGDPRSRPLYFILDTEKASTERVQIKNHGYKALLEANENLFPILSILETLQSKQTKKPLWQLYQELKEDTEQTALLKKLNQYIQDFITERKLVPSPIEKIASSLEEAFEQLIQVAIEQFHDKSTTRSEINDKYKRSVKEQIFNSFVQARGRAGGVLVLSQNQLLLLTNLAIGKKDKLRLYELIKAFKERGFYLDNQSQQTLVNFYERMGNVERMSDSGDAVYVRKTI